MPIAYQELLDISLAREVCKRAGMGRNLREGCHVSLHEVAAALGVTASAVSRWETGTEPRGANATRYGALCRLWLDMQTTFDAVEG